MTTSRHRPYQGYPYVDPPVIDAPSISADDAARWHHLPRRQLELNVRETPSDAPGLRGQSASLPAKRDSDHAPVLYIDLPETSGSIVADRQTVYTIEDDFEIIQSQPKPQGSRSNYKRDSDTPVVYIDIPEENGSDVARSREPSPEEPAFQETIFYDPFENRRIDRAKEVSDEESDVSNYNRQMPPRRPNTLDLNGAGTSAGSSASNPGSSTPGMSSLMTKETDIYGCRDGNLPQSATPRSEFPDPPPAYAEIDALSSPAAVPKPRPACPPKTLVITPRDNAPITPSQSHNGRKFLNCHHCGMRVQTLVVQEIGTVTHAAAVSCLIIACFPAIIFIYWTDYFKDKNHYCPNCNKIIGYQQPFKGDSIIFVNSSA